MPITDTKLIGNIVELQVQTYMTQLGVMVSIPYGDRARYDQIWDTGENLLRVQIKHAKESEDYFTIPGKSSVRRQGKRVDLRYTSDEIEGIATFFNGKVYYVPVDELSRSGKTLRFNSPKNNALSIVNWAEDYEVEKQLNIQS